jgi:hypothetical protein
MFNNSKNKNSIHIIFGATCSNSMDWKSIAMFHSFKTSGWEANGTKITRVMACTDEQLKNYKGMDIGPTFTFTDQQTISGYKDSPTYNKPAGIMHFTQEVDIDEEYILFIDSDMLLRKVISPEEFQTSKGMVITEWVWYIQEGIQNGLAKQFLKDEQSIQNASGTHGGYYHLFHKDDAKKVAPLWLHYTREFRHHKERYFAKLPNSKLKEDIDVVQKGLEYGEAPWISEMYGYALAAAEVGLKHRFTRGGGGVLYGDDFLSLNHDGPFLSHYTLSCHIPSVEIFTNEKKNRNDKRGDRNNNNNVDGDDEYIFNKSEVRDFSPLDCDDGFLFERSSKVLVDEGAASCAENVQRINYALCDYYKNHCSPSSRAYKRSIRFCPWDTNAPFNLHYDAVKPAPCGNQDDAYCKEEAEYGRCKYDPSFMQLQCLEECGFCATMQPHGRNGHSNYECKDIEETSVCEGFKNEMECVLNPTYMVVNCRKTCGKCPNDIPNSSTINARTRPQGIRTSTSITAFSESSVFRFTDNQTKLILFVSFCLVLLVIPKVMFWRRLSNRGQNKKAT